MPLRWASGGERSVMSGAAQAELLLQRGRQVGFFSGI